MNGRRLSSDEAKALGLDDENSRSEAKKPAGAPGRRLSVDEAAKLGLDNAGEPPWLTPGYKAPPKPAPEQYPYAPIKETLAEMRASKNEVTQPEASLRGGTSAVFPWIDEITGGMKALAETKDIRQLPAVYRAKRDEERARTQMAAQNYPKTFYGTGAAGMGATMFLPKIGMAKQAETTGQAIWQGVKAGGARGAVDAAGRSEADLTQGEITPFLVDTAIGAGTGATVGGAMGGGAHWLTRGAEKRAQKDIVRKATEGADPTHSRRLAGRQGEVAEPVVNFVRQNKPIQKALGSSEKMADATDEIASKATAQTGPIYDKLDRAVGEVPVRDLTGYLDGEIGQLERNYGTSSEMVRALKSARDNVATTAAARGGGASKLVDQRGNPVPDTGTMTHKDLRSWVTKLLKEEQRTMGGLSETAKYEIKDKLHDIGDKFLKDRLRGYGAQSPELGADVDKLSKLNTDIAMALRLNQAADNATARAYYTNRNPLIGALASGAAGQVLGASGSPTAAITTYVATQATPKAIRATGRKVNQATAWLVRKAREGSATADVVQQAIERGVPPTVAQGIAAMAVKTFGTKRAQPQKKSAEPLDWGDEGSATLDWGTP